MRKLALSLSFIICHLSFSPVGAQEDTLTTFIRENPNAVDFNVIYEGTRLYLSADDDNLLVNLSVALPALQMRLLMMPMSVYVDPTGKKKRSYEVVLPSALDVKEQLEAQNPRPGSQATTNGQRPMANGQSERPDIQPLLVALNARGAELKSGSQQLHLGYQRFYMELDREHEVINYYMLLPKSMLMKAKGLSDTWAVGIFSANDMANMPPPEEGEGGMMPPPMEGDDAEEIQQLMQGDIRSWTKFSIDDVNNANLKADEPENPIEARTRQMADSLCIEVTVREIETQLTFLMQGMSIHLNQADSLTFTFPAAPLVRSKVRRHPNEVKAVLAHNDRRNVIGNDTVNQVVRPDVLPLVAALNDTTATITVGAAASEPHNTIGAAASEPLNGPKRTPSRSFNISVDRENALMTFTARLPKSLVNTTGGVLDLTLTSQPMGKGDRAEYEGNRLSGEKAPSPRGLGEGIRRDNAASRSLHVSLRTKIE